MPGTELRGQEQGGGSSCQGWSSEKVPHAEDWLRVGSHLL